MAGYYSDMNKIVKEKKEFIVLISHGIAIV